MTEDGLSTFQPRTYSCKHIYAVCLFLLFSMDSRTFLKFLRWRECVMIQIGLTPIDLQPKPIKWYSHCNTILHLMKILYLKQWENYLYPVLEWERERALSQRICNQKPETSFKSTILFYMWRLWNEKEKLRERGRVMQLVPLSVIISTVGDQKLQTSKKLRCHFFHMCKNAAIYRNLN